MSQLTIFIDENINLASARADGRRRTPENGLAEEASQSRASPQPAAAKAHAKRRPSHKAGRLTRTRDTATRGRALHVRAKAQLTLVSPALHTSALYARSRVSPITRGAL